MKRYRYAIVPALALFGGLLSGAVAHADTQTCFALDGKADVNCTPGAFNPDVTQDTINDTICVSGWTRTVRPPASYTTALKNQQKIAYGEADISNADLEEDHLVPLELGGAPRDPNNLWPQPRTSVSNPGAEDKDKEENSLKVQVCNGDITLDQARQQMLADWTH
ncbi:hypothetical protein F0L68_39625 [Solihabitans fulvus]|uniref:HNH endonuclease n=1 Tax=Solihabitans fulvus TaxID=1892852 RepID=A0A5B2WDP3_9PSEU|nr:hypothetical protein [Solihabitans fulvus]KAA2248742.1 hypothetical protein F0L68_39625 [Solihabitans fulvus]